MAKSFKELITLIRDGDFVEEAVLNAILRELHGNAVYLRDQFASALLGESIFARSVTVDSSAAVGMAVYYSSSDARWKQGLASAAVDSSGNVSIAAAGQVWGIVYSKQNSTLADLLLLGYAEIDLSAAIDGTVTAGQYFLSGTAAGKLGSTSPPVGIPVLQVAGPGELSGTHKVFVKTSFLDFFHSHQHYKFDLVPLPAGTASLAGGRWSIPSPDAASAGWLPADHATFSGNAPDGAVFGYNMAASSIGDVWPPLPVSSVVMEWNRGVDANVGFTGVPNDLVIMDATGIWWMSNCENDVPWPEDVNSTTTTTTTTTITPECPRDLGMAIRVFFTKMAFQTDNAVVSSLRVAAGSEDLVEITCPDDGLPATTGNLQIAVDLALVEGAEVNDLDARAYKNLTVNELSKGPVVTRIRPGSNNVQIAGTASEDYKYGDLTITVVETTTGSVLPVEVVRLDGVEEENYADVLALMFPPAKTTAFRGRILVPDLSVSTVSLVLRTWWLGRTTGTFPVLNMSYRELPRPDPAATPVALPASDTAVVLNGTAVSFASANTYFELDSGVITANPASTILFTIERPGAGGDGYTGELHLIRQAGAVTGTT